ncbi:MAG: hydrolase TatD [Gammaproteobacteria bacterium]|nr:MAG: hydrolase TatD [Gammaproteobacteria bacterium]
MLIDIGANLTHKSFDKDLTNVINEAEKSGVKKIIITGADRDSNKQALKICDEYPLSQLYVTAGCHPHYAKDFKSSDIKTIKDNINNPHLKAIGECGLDYFRNFSPRQKQIDCFKMFLELSCELQKPLFLHQRDSFDDFIKIIEPYLKDIPKYVVHCWTGAKDELEVLIKKDAYIGITGWVCDEKRGEHLHEQLKIIPNNRLMIETDSPYLTPKTLKNKNHRNVPANLPHIAKYIAKITNKTYDQICQQTTNTAINFFGL